VSVTPQLARRMADRRFGVGCDQVIVLEDSPIADVFMRIFNADGTQAGACGNATRCVAALFAQEHGVQKVAVQTVAGVLPAVILGPGLVEVDMGVPGLEWGDVPLAAPADTLRLALSLGPVSGPAACSMGNPHATFFVDTLDGLNVEALGPVLERSRNFPERANIGFAVVESETRVRLRVWERGAGLTLACGSGACAAAVNAVRRGFTGRVVNVVMDGGELRITWREDGHVLMRGGAETVFGGVWDDAA
jgi:diaminopimelate epimerase